MEQSHPLSEQEQAMQDTLLHIFRSLCHRSAVPRVPNTNAVAVVDRDGPQVIGSPTTPPFNAQDLNTVFPSEISVPPLTIRDTHVVISGTSKVPRPSSVHQGGNEVQSREVLYGRPGAALEEHYQGLQLSQTENIKGPYFQHGLRAEEISAQSDVNPLSGNGNSRSERSTQRSISRGDREALNTSLDRREQFNQSSISPCKTLDPLSGSSTAGVATYDANAFSDNGNTLSEESPQPSISLGGKEVLNDQGDASLDRFKKSTLAFLTLGTSIRDPYHSGRNLDEVSNVSHSQSLHAVSSEPVVAQFPVQNSMFRSAQKVNIGGNASLMNIARDNVVTNVVKYDGTHGVPFSVLH
ncbi:hypothetical protein M378DRAFT_157934 [Amanita muscaria Koide BX008]|uniref:Uncharacterized protein n=1 Tax=Amanita muscaria (strain Koide BX008) TaxID=946122 RepID=A0A0C2X3N7_AMAMK|nr:hypothetical protein M378DRAFT_157934 [Amanita muscaria Koide BX008]